jgi:hypothetical protein
MSYIQGNFRSAVHNRDLSELRMEEDFNQNDDLNALAVQYVNAYMDKAQCEESLQVMLVERLLLDDKERVVKSSKGFFEFWVRAVASIQGAQLMHHVHMSLGVKIGDDSQPQGLRISPKQVSQQEMLRLLDGWLALEFIQAGDLIGDKSLKASLALREMGAMLQAHAGSFSSPNPAHVEELDGLLLLLNQALYSGKDDRNAPIYRIHPWQRELLQLARMIVKSWRSADIAGMVQGDYAKRYLDVSSVAYKSVSLGVLDADDFCAHVMAHFMSAKKA